MISRLRPQILSDSVQHTGVPALMRRLLAVSDRSAALVTLIAESVALDIIEERLQPGTDLNSVELARRFSCSRTPVREALMLLERGGLVDIPARRRPRVAGLAFDRIEEIYRLRSELYSLVSERVARHAGPAHLTALRHELAKMSRAANTGDLSGYFWANVSFHECASDAASDLTLKRTLDSLGVQVLRLRHYSLSLPNRMMLSLEDHERLVRAYREHDASLAGALARSIVVRAFEAMVADRG